MTRKPSAQLTGTLVIAGIDIARHLARAYGARRERHDHELSSLAAHLADEAAHTAARARVRSRNAAVNALSHTPGAVRDRLPWPHQRPWHERHRALLLVPALGGLIVALLAIATSATRRMAHSPPVLDRVGEAATAARAAAGDQKRVAAAVTAASTAATSALDATSEDTSTIAAAGKAAAKQVVGEKVKQPIVHKAQKYGALALAGLTAYIIVIAVAVQLLVAQLS